jgi:hypothetical protein
MKQKYEDKIRELTDDIVILVENKDFIKVSTIKNQWKMRLQLENAIYMGEPLKPYLDKYREANGIFPTSID